jgi:Tfp pilus assembly protein PilF
MKRILLAVLIAAPLAAQTTPVEQGRAALARKDPQAAVNILQETVAKTPQNAEAHYLLGVAYGALAEKANPFRQPALARHTRDEFERAVRADPNHLDARLGLVQYYSVAPGFLGGSEQKALQQAEEIRKRDVLAAHRAFAFIYIHRKDYQRAASELETVVQIDGNDMPSWYEIGRLAALSGTNLQRGEDALQRYLRHSPAPDEPPLDRARYWLVRIYERQGRR